MKIYRGVMRAHYIFTVVLTQTHKKLVFKSNKDYHLNLQQCLDVSKNEEHIITDMIVSPPFDTEM